MASLSPDQLSPRGFVRDDDLLFSQVDMADCSAVDFYRQL